MVLELLHIADSALPIGAAAHSFGLETLVEEGLLSPQNVEAFLRDYLLETGMLESRFVRLAWHGDDVNVLSDQFGARRLARESRDASLKMARRFSKLLNALLGTAVIPDRLHYPVAFGLAGAALNIPEEETTLAYLRQSIAGMISACQRLMPVGQVEASCLLWNLHSAIAEAASGQNIHQKTQQENREVACFTPLLDLASIRHCSLETRLFIS